MEKKPIEDQISLEDILAEFAPTDGLPATPPIPPIPEAELEPVKETVEAVKAEPKQEKAAPAPAKREPTSKKAAPAPKREAKKPAEASPAQPEAPKEPAQPPKKKEPVLVTPSKEPWWKQTTRPQKVSDKVIQLPEADGSVTARIGRLIEKGDRYAQSMFEGDAPEELEREQERERRERLLPGVDWESEPTHAPAPRRHRVLRRPKPDTPPGKLAAGYKKGLGFLHTRTLLALLWCLPQLFLALAPGLGLPLPAALTPKLPLVYAGGLCVSALLCADVLAHGLMCLLRLRPESETVLLFTVAAALADALSVDPLGIGEVGLPFCPVASVCLFFAMWGRLLKRRGLWRSCRAAAGAAEPYLVTLDEKMWNNQDSFVKWSGTVEGYGSQVQDTDGVQRAYHLAAPLILLCAGLFALLASVGRREPRLFFRCLSICLTAGCGFTAALSFSMPFSALSRRLSKLGAALGGWDGVAWQGRNRGVILTDTDLFPPGSITLNGIKLMGEQSMETSLSYTATLMLETDSGLAKPFSDMLRAKGGLHRKVSQVMFHEGGVSGTIAGQAVLVGSGAFMELMGVNVPQGLKVKTAVFCAVDGQLSAIFALNYTLHPAIAQAVDVLVDNGMDPILATRDFLVIPDMLRQRFKLPVDKMEFPSLDRRRELSAQRREHERTLTAVLCREGLGPYAEAVVGSKRLLGAVRAGLLFDLLGAGLGLVMSFYLCLARAFASLTPGTMLAFLLLWLVPAALISGWVNRY